MSTASTSSSPEPDNNGQTTLPPLTLKLLTVAQKAYLDTFIPAFRKFERGPDCIKKGAKKDYLLTHIAPHFINEFHLSGPDATYALDSIREVSSKL
jgi:hypothetical protein